jgi:hypothetical protein
VELGKAAQIDLTLYTLLGEKVYEAKTSGITGLNNLTWKLNNGSGAGVASGLYLYSLEILNRSVNYRKTGKVIVLH